MTNTINCYADLEQEEMRLKKRIIIHEQEIKLKLQTLPEEIIVTGITKIITGFLNGDIFKIGASIIKTVSAVFLNKKNEDKSFGSSLMSIVKNIIKDKLGNN